MKKLFHEMLSSELQTNNCNHNSLIDYSYGMIFNKVSRMVNTNKYLWDAQTRNAPSLLQ